MMAPEPDDVLDGSPGAREDLPGRCGITGHRLERRELDESKLVAGARIVGGTRLVEFLADGTPCVTY